MTEPTKAASIRQRRELTRWAKGKLTFQFDIPGAMATAFGTIFDRSVLDELARVACGHK